MLFTLCIRGFYNYMSPNSERLCFKKKYVCTFLINENVDINIKNILLQVIIC